MFLLSLFLFKKKSVHELILCSLHSLPWYFVYAVFQVVSYTRGTAVPIHKLFLVRSLENDISSVAYSEMYLYGTKVAGRND